MNSSFKKKAPWVMALLMQDFPIGLEDAAAIVGNLGHESAGLQAINEKNPTVAGSRGGFGWAQWTGPRRRKFEEYCARNGLALSSDVAQYKFLFVELTTTEKGAIPKTVAADTLEEKVEAFELGFERAGIKHYPSRVKWAESALDIWHNASEADKRPPWAETVPAVPTPRPEPEPTPLPPPNHNGGPPLDPDEVGGPVEKVVGAGKGNVAGGVAGMSFSAALVWLAGAYGYIPAGVDGAMFGVAVTAIVQGVTQGIASMIGVYRSKKNSV